jgi:hypothetical protein
LSPAVRRFPAFPAAALLGAPVSVFAAVFAFTPVRKGEGFVLHAPVGHQQPAFAFPPVFTGPAVTPGPAFSGTAAPVVPADAGTPAAGIRRVIRRISGQYIRVFTLTHGNLEMTQPDGRVPQPVTPVSKPG